MFSELPIASNRRKHIDIAILIYSNYTFMATAILDVVNLKSIVSVSNRELRNYLYI